jgi:hypothetical protein
MFRSGWNIAGIVAVALLASGCAIEHHQTHSLKDSPDANSPQRTGTVTKTTGAKITGAKTPPIAHAPKPAPEVTGAVSLREWCKQRYVDHIESVLPPEVAPTPGKKELDDETCRPYITGRSDLGEDTQAPP